MKKYLILIIVMMAVQKANCDLVRIAGQYALFNYTIKGIYSYEVAKKEKSSLLFTGGIGIVGSLFAFYDPAMGIELQIEKRRYFKPKEYQDFFISSYLGIEYTNDFGKHSINDFAVIPGFKLSHKSVISPYMVIEPYIGLSFPITFNIPDGLYFPVPLATLGLRMGLCKT